MNSTTSNNQKQIHYIYQKEENVKDEKHQLKLSRWILHKIIYKAMS